MLYDFDTVSMLGENIAREGDGDIEQERVGYVNSVERDRNR